MGILDKIKEESKKSGQSKGKFIYFREDEKKRIRFLTDFEDALEIVFHDSFEQGINVPCQELYGKPCEYCEAEGLRTRNLYAWSVYDYESKDVKILMQAVNNCTAIPGLMALYEDRGTLLDRDFVLKKTGKQQNTTYTVVPQDKNAFRNSKAKPFSEKAILKYLNQAYPDENGSDDDDDDFEDVKKTNKKKGTSQSDEYDDMSARELYQLCKERDIEVLPKKTEKYYVKLLAEYDEAQEDWSEEDEDEEWPDDDTVDYDEMTDKELYQLCKERKIAGIKPKQKKSYYIKKLEEFDEGDFDEEEDEEWED